MSLNSIQNFLKIEGEELVLDGRKLFDLEKKFGTPIYIYSLSTVKENISKLKKLESKFGRNFKILYAMKAFSHKTFLKYISSLDVGVETVSIGEVLKAVEAGFKPENIMYNGLGKNKAVLRMLVESNYAGVNLDSEYEFQLAGELGLINSRNIGVRINLEIKKRVLDTSSPTSKFGLEPRRLFQLIDKYRIKRLGIHTHVGSQITDKRLVEDLIKKFIELINRLSNRYGVEINYIDIGGGIPKDYTWTPIPLEVSDINKNLFRPNYSINQYISLIHKLSKKVDKDVPIYVEPGRYIVADAGILLTRVVGYKERLNKVKWIFLDTGFTHLLSGFLYKWYFPLVNVSRILENHDTSFRVAGILCDSDDVFHDYEGEKKGRPSLPRFRPLPKSTDVGDLMAFLHVGAYNYEEASTYNSIDKPNVIFI